MSTPTSTNTATDGQQAANDATAAEGTAAEAQQAAEQQGAEGTETTEEGKGGNKAGQEAAKYRKQLRETEAERDALTGTVETLQRQLIAQNMPGISKMNADALWSAGASAADFFTAEGAIDADKLQTAVRDLHQRFGLHFGLDPVPGSGKGTGATGDGPSWSKVMNKAKR